ALPLRQHPFPTRRSSDLTEIGRSSSLAVEGPDSQDIPTLPFENSGAAEAAGRLVYADAGLPEDFPADTQGAIALIKRDGVVFFRSEEHTSELQSRENLVC